MEMGQRHRDTIVFIPNLLKEGRVTDILEKVFPVQKFVSFRKDRLT